MPDSACPGEHELRRLLGGAAPEALATQLGEHLESCASCLRIAARIEQEDPLVHALRTAVGAHDPADDSLTRAILQRVTGASAHTDSEAGMAETEPPPPPGHGAREVVTVTRASGDGQERLGFDAAAILAPAQAADELGRLGSYRVLRVLGQGGMGAVLLAEDTKLGRRVALKVMLPRLTASASGKLRFLREARAAAQVRHDNLVVIHHVDEDRGIPFLAMEYLEGETLDSRLKRDGNLPLAEVLRIGIELAHGLAAAHQCGLIHRDVKPGNVWLEVGWGRVKLLDFGLVRAREDEGRLTGDGGWLGTPAYMAPEQVLDPSHVEPAADLFSLGCVLYEMSTGSAPFAAGDAISVKISGQRRPPLPPGKHNAALPAAFADLVLRLLHPEPEQRGAGAAVVAAELERIAKSAAAPRRRWLLAAGLLLPLFVGLIAAVLVIRTPAGDVTVETDDPNIELTARGNDLVRIRDLKTGKTLTLDAGKYTLAMTDDPDGVTVELPGAGPIVLRRAGAKVVTITRKAAPAAAAPPVAMPKVPRPDERVPADALDRAAIPRAALAWPGGGDPDRAPPELVAILGDGRLRALGPSFAPDLSPDGRWLAVTSGTDVTLFDAQTGQYVRTLRGHTDMVYVARFSPNSKILASAGPDHIVRLWDVATGRLLRAFEAHKAPIPSLAFNKDGTRLATSSYDRTVAIWDLEHGTRLREFTGHTSIASSVAFSPDGTLIASGSWSWEVRVWDAVSGAAVQVLRMPGAREGHGDYPDMVGVAFSPDGTRLAAGNDHFAVLWDTTNWQRLWSRETPAQRIHYTPDGRHVWTSGGKAAGAATRTFKRWDTANGELVETLPLPGRGFFGETALSQDGKTLAVCGEWNSVAQLVDTHTGRPRFPSSGHTAPVESVAFSADGHRLASCGRDARICIWDLATGNEERVLTGHTAAVRRVAFLPDGRTLASCSEDRTVRLWDSTSGKLLWKFDKHTDVVVRLAVSPDGRTLASGGYDGTIRLYDWPDRAVMRTIDGLDSRVEGLCFSDDGKWLAAVLQNGQCRVWETLMGRPIRTFMARQTGGAAAFLPDGDRLLTTLVPGRLWEFAIAGNEVVRQLRLASVCPTSLALRADRRLIATSGAGGVFELCDWQARTPTRQTYRLFPYDSWIPDAAFGPEGRYLATANPDGTVYLFRFASAATKTLPGLSRPDRVIQPARQFTGHSNWLYWVAFSRDGKTAVSASSDRTVRLWDVADGTQRQRLEHPAPAIHVALSADDREVITTCVDRIARVWNRADGTLTRQLEGTHNEWVLSLSADGRRVLTYDADAKGPLIVTDFATGKPVARLSASRPFSFGVWLPGGKRLLIGTAAESLAVTDADGADLVPLRGHGSWIRDLAVSPDGRLALSCAGAPGNAEPASNIFQDASTRLWDLETGQELRRWQENSYSRWGVCFTPGGRRAVAGSNDGTIRVYDIATGVELACLESPAPIHGVAVSPDGRSVLGGCGDGVLRLWQLPDGVADPP
jgi:WD40 repeat protein